MRLTRCNPRKSGQIAGLLLNVRNPLQKCAVEKLNRICLLCTEKTADTCHRRLAAEYIASQIPDIEIVHL